MMMMMMMMMIIIIIIIILTMYDFDGLGFLSHCSIYIAFSLLLPCVCFVWESIYVYSQNCEKRLLASPCLSIRLCVCVEQLGSHCTEFHEI